MDISVGEGEKTPWWVILVLVVSALSSGYFSAQNIGICSLDIQELELMTEGPFENQQDEKRAQRAKKILPLRRRGNLVLCTILLWITMSNSIFSIMLSAATSQTIGLVVSIVVLVTFAEILPQSVAVRYGLALGSSTIYVLWGALIMTFVATYPIAFILDKVLGDEVGSLTSKYQIKRLFQQYEDSKFLSSSERKMLSAALELQDKSAAVVMTPFKDAFMLDINSKFDEHLLQTIYSHGFSRIPIYQGSKENIVGILNSRDLILINIDEGIKTLEQLSSILIRDVILIDSQTKLDPILSFFKKGENHMGIVTQAIQEAGKDPELRKVGILTLEDIIEELLQEEIIDEQEQEDFKDSRKKIKEKMIYLFSDHQAGKVLNKLEMFAITEFLSKQVGPFQSDKIDRESLDELIYRSEVISLESDSKPYTHYKEPLDGSLSQGENQGMRNEEQYFFQRHLELTRLLNLEEPAAPQKKSKRKKSAGESSTKNSDSGLLNNANLQVKPAENQSEEALDIIEGIRKASVSNITDANDMDIPDEKNIIKKKKLLTKEQIHLQRIQKEQSPILFMKDIPSDEFYLILQGKVVLCSGNDGFLVDMGPYYHIGADALTVKNFKPDFSAKVVSHAKLLRVTRDDYQQAIKGS